MSDAPRTVTAWELLRQRPRTGGWLPTVTRTYRMPDGSVSEWDIHEVGFNRAGPVEPAGSCWAFGASTWRRHVVVARDCERLVEPTSWGGDEYCLPVLVAVDDFRALLRTGDSTDVDLGYLALDAAGLL